MLVSYFSDDINLCKHLLTSLLSMTQRLRSSMHLLRDLAQDIHSQLGDIDQVGFYVYFLVSRVMLTDNFAYLSRETQMFGTTTFAFKNYPFDITKYTSFT